MSENEPHDRSGQEWGSSDGRAVREPAQDTSQHEWSWIEEPAARAQETGSSDARHVDVLIVGAGVSGIGAAHHLRERFADRSFVILEAQDDRGGTWWTHRFPGIRSDSDLFTYGYRHKPWRGPSIAAGGAILDYLDEVIADDDLAGHIRYRHRVTALEWSSAAGRWTAA